MVALGETGLHAGGEEEEEAFLEQLALARQLKLRVVVHTPVKDKERHTRRILTLLRDVGRAAGAGARGPRQRAHRAQHPGLWTLGRAHPAPRGPQGRARRGPGAPLGSERLVLNSDAGDGAGDLLGLARVAHLLTKAKLSERVVKRVASENAARFYRPR